VFKVGLARIVHMFEHGMVEQEKPMDTSNPTLGELIAVFYDELVKEYGDEELASIIASTLVNEMILSGARPEREIAAA